MALLVRAKGRAHIIPTDPEESITDEVLEASLEDEALCGRLPYGGWFLAWQDDDDPDLCDRCARLAEGRGGFRGAGIVRG